MAKMSFEPYSFKDDEFVDRDDKNFMLLDEEERKKDKKNEEEAEQK